MKTIVDRIGLPARPAGTDRRRMHRAGPRLSQRGPAAAGREPDAVHGGRVQKRYHEEMADIALCLDILDDSDYTLDPIIAKAKLDRWHKRLDEAGK